MFKKRTSRVDKGHHILARTKPHSECLLGQDTKGVEKLQKADLHSEEDHQRHQRELRQLDLEDDEKSY